MYSLWLKDAGSPKSTRQILKVREDSGRVKFALSEKIFTLIFCQGVLENFYLENWFVDSFDKKTVSGKLKINGFLLDIWSNLTKLQYGSGKDTNSMEERKILTFFIPEIID